MKERHTVFNLKDTSGKPRRVDHPVSGPYIIFMVLEVVGGVTLGFVGLETARYALHRARLRRIPHRIHVNGSRGKSSVTRLIGGALGAGPFRVVVKTTGTAPRFITPDLREIPIFRPGRPNILEQVKVVREAARLGADVLVAECMAITPEYIQTLEDRIIRSTVGVITNVREDHLDVMGPTVYDVAVHLALSLPRNGVAFTTEERYFDVLAREARRRGTVLHRVSVDVTDAEMARFPYIEHAENVALALAVARHFGVDREKALEGMIRFPPDPGVLREWVLELGGHRVWFFDAMAANDPDSTLKITEMARKRHPGLPLLALLVLRRDRPQRTEAFARLLGERLMAEGYLVVGSPTAYVVRELQRKGVRGKVVALEDPEGDAVVDALKTMVDGPSLVVAMGNHVGLGEAIVASLSAHRVDLKQEV